MVVFFLAMLIFFGFQCVSVRGGVLGLGGIVVHQEALQQRALLRQHPDVLAAIYPFWDMVRKDSSNLVNKKGYLQLHRAIHSAMVPGACDPVISEQVRLGTVVPALDILRWQGMGTMLRGEIFNGRAHASTSFA